ncbi:DUF3303 family protein [Raineyella sp. LH-20]|uniref:DUF3303 family protein n=1 Tax=Raineyella sp. LH-20 TaxID=3081204 RepID=UPI00295325DE|nr:DUF3303 family protein [Raineyella sp. LH-20]WOP19240.1 DUF3303 family protein [Raineyella sp. LH-20]
MFYQVIHTHLSHDCPARRPETAKQFDEWWEALKSTDGVTVHVGAVAPVPHTFYFYVETDDYARLVRALAWLNSIGSGEVVPVVPLDLGMGLVREGVYFTED